MMSECWEHWKEERSWPDMMMSVTACDGIMCSPPLFFLLYNGFGLENRKNMTKCF